MVHPGSAALAAAVIPVPSSTSSEVENGRHRASLSGDPPAGTLGGRTGRGEQLTVGCLC